MSILLVAAAPHAVNSAMTAGGGLGAIGLLAGGIALIISGRRKSRKDREKKRQGK